MKLIESRKKSSFQLESKVKYAADTMETDDGLQRQNKFSTSSIFLNSFLHIFLYWYYYSFILLLIWYHQSHQRVSSRSTNQLSPPSFNMNTTPISLHCIRLLVIIESVEGKQERSIILKDGKLILAQILIIDKRCTNCPLIQNIQKSIHS